MQETRQAIINILKKHGLATVDQLSNELRLTAVTIRHHLDILRSEGLVDAPKVKRRPTPGRPQHVYALTDRATEFFPKNYVAFADLTLREVRAQVGSEAMHAIVQGIARRMASEAPAPAPGEALNQKLERAVDFLNERGYIARWEVNEGGYLLHTTNCPYRGLAQHHNEPCAMDMALIAELVGASPQRINWITAGDSTCSYLVTNGVEH